MNLQKLFRNKRAVSAVLSTIFLLGVTIAGVSIVYVITSNYTDFNSNIDEAGVVEVNDYNKDGLIDAITMPLANRGMSKAKIDSVIVFQDDQEFIWFTLDTDIDVSDYSEIDLYAIGISQQIEFFIPFYIQFNMVDDTYISNGFVASFAEDVPDAVIPQIIADIGDDGGDDGGDDDDDGFSFEGFELLVARTEDDDAYAKKKFPTDTGYSPTKWFILGEFDDDNKRADVSTDFIDLCGHGNELEYQPYLLDTNQFTAGDIGTQSGNAIMPFTDAGNHPGLVAIDKYGNWDKKDDLNWGKRGVVYMWTYIYVTEETTQTVSLGMNGASDIKVYLNGDLAIEGGGKKNRWYTEDSLTLNPGLNLVMMKISAKTNAHFAGQILFYNNANLANFYSVWPTINDL